MDISWKENAANPSAWPDNIQLSHSVSSQITNIATPTLNAWNLPFHGNGRYKFKIKQTEKVKVKV